MSAYRYWPGWPAISGLAVVAILALTVAWMRGNAPTAAADEGPIVADQFDGKWDGKTYEAHEWGTFTSVQGANGSVLDGLMHEERDLPEFVYDLRDMAGINGVSPKMETPVIYFYSAEPRIVRVRVRFPRGAITQWYPAASDVNFVGNLFNGMPERPTGRHITNLQNGFISWGHAAAQGDLKILGRDDAPNLPPVADDDPWRFARIVDANVLHNCNLNLARQQVETNGGTFSLQIEYEKFLFYRGLGNFALPLQGAVRGEQFDGNRYEANLTLANATPAEPITHLFVIRVANGRAGFAYFPALGAQPLSLTNLSFEMRPLAESTETLVHELAACLTQTGLFADEALAMARTWQAGYFQDEGLRVLYVLPSAFIDRELPLEFEGVDGQTHTGPKNVVRTFVGRTELLSPEQETAILTAVTALASGDTAEREAAKRTLDSWGRFAIPYLNRAKALATDAAIRAEIDGLLERHILRR